VLDCRSKATTLAPILMSGYLWKYYLEDDVENFRRVLLESGYTTRTGGATQKGHTGGKDHIGLGIGSAGSFATSPTLVVKSRKDIEAGAHGGLTLTRADINHRDSSGRTLLHLAASSPSDNAFDFASALLEHPLTDIYNQDNENAWTALHRAFYVGNVAVAHRIILRDLQDALGHGATQLHHLVGGLIKIKDKEGNGPFDLFEMTLEGEMTDSAHLRHHAGAASDSDDESMPGNYDEGKIKGSLISYTDLQGDEMFTFGSNQNVTLGFGDEDDRHNPERISLRRPDHLYFEAYQEYVRSLNSHWVGGNSTGNVSKSSVLQPVFVSDLPSAIKNKPIRIQNVYLAKLHSAVLTDDSKSNLHVCGHGKGGRLGLGDERTRFQFVCVDNGAIANRKIAAVALGLNHTVALSDQGEVFTWGNNDCGQLGYDLPKTSLEEETIQTYPRRIFGPLKKEIIVGVAASRIHSVAYTDSALYTWGKNEGQLGIVHSESRSTKIQAIPRNVAASRFSSPISSVSAIDRATTVLLENREVVVFAHYVYIKVDFPLHGFDNYFLRASFMTTKYDTTPNRICKIVSAGETICALSSSGQVYTVAVSEPPALQDNEASTTNPKLGSRNALSSPVRVWSNKKAHLSARDVDIDQNGSIILVTHAGSVWRRVRRVKIKDATASGVGENKPKDHKFSRIPGLTRVTAVRASGYGAYAAVREDCLKMRDEIVISPSTLLNDIWPLVPFQTLYPADNESPAFPKRDLVDMILKSTDPDEDIRSILQPRDAPVLPYDLLLCSTTTDIEIPIHQFIISARSKIVRTALEELNLFEQFTIPDVLIIKREDNERIRIILQGADVVTLFNLALYFYTDSLAPVWTRPPKQQMAYRYRQVRVELQKIANKLGMNYLESALKRIVLPASTLHQDMEIAYADSAFFEHADVIVTLANGEEAWVHGALACQRCPFFDGLFRGRTGGQWLSERRRKLDGPEDAIRVDLSNISQDVFQKVLRHIYAGTGPELFDDIVADGLDEFLDTVVDVMSAANELMLDRLSEVCQQVVGRYGEYWVSRIMST
jgi:alpha-tubulin suppressor-like RCC1 family protein